MGGAGKAMPEIKEEEVKAMRKKITMICLAAVIAASALFAAACGTDLSDSKYLGKWTATQAEYSGVKMSVKDILGGDFTFTLKEDGTVDMKIINDEQSGKWNETEDGIQIDGDEDMTFVDQDGALVLTYTGVTITFEKE